MMRKAITLGLFLLAITAAWLAVAPPQVRIFPLVNGQGAPSGWWMLRQHTLYLSGLWSVGLMSLCMVLALRWRWIERLVGGLDQVYRLHKWAGIAAGVTAIAHWGAKESAGWIKGLWGTAGRPAKELVLPWAMQFRSPAKDIGEWAFYILLGLLLITLWQQLVNYKHWRWTHRVMPLIFLALTFHAVMLMPVTFWGAPLGVLMTVLLGAGSVAAIVSLSGRIGAQRNHLARVVSVKSLGDSHSPVAPLEVVCAMPTAWRGHKPGQFVFASFDRMEGAHPFTIASAAQSMGKTPQGESLLRLVIKPLGDYTNTLASALHADQTVRIEGPYGCFDAQGSADRQQVWVAAGVGITPFLALLESRQPGFEDMVNVTAHLEPVQMHYCTPNAKADALLPRIRDLCGSAVPPVSLTVHDTAAGDLLRPEALKQRDRRALDIWFCGPQGLAEVLRRGCRQLGAGQWRLHLELFAMR